MHIEQVHDDITRVEVEDVKDWTRKSPVSKKLLEKLVHPLGKLEDPIEATHSTVNKMMGMMQQKF